MKTKQNIDVGMWCIVAVHLIRVVRYSITLLLMVDVFLLTHLVGSIYGTEFMHFKGD